MTRRDALTLTLPDGGELAVALIRRERKSIGLTIRDGRVEIVAPPRVPLSRLAEVLDARRDWLVRHWLAFEARRAELAALPAAPEWLGQPLDTEWTGPGRAACRRDGGKLIVAGPHPEREPDAFSALLVRWLKREAATTLAERVTVWSRASGLVPSRLQLSGARRRWGSCAADGTVRLNWRLVQAPTAIIDYVVVHELSHLKHMNHSAAFWSVVASHLPDWAERRCWLKRHGERLFRHG
ncbi:M48 family metallopeptidase [Crenobacter cavernae]|uniref:M48 family peptidase n=1 Tax=Crenobacter cavernae TaxID=2290923 RepID=A0ABY0FIW6_9NEIS|nr:SprT family zinc-dependent metalloprotease [Crenobacter cavernae]RXZ45029.1 M48 family peptidase [Crenobacter cavernae]